MCVVLGNDRCQYLRHSHYMLLALEKLRHNQ